MLKMVVYGGERVNIGVNVRVNLKTVCQSVRTYLIGCDSQAGRPIVVALLTIDMEVSIARDIKGVNCLP